MPKTIKTQMERKLFKRSAIAACVMTAFAVQAQAQDNEDPAILEEVVVYGIQQSLQNAQDIKRDASSVKDVITASDIGALPDKSIVESLQRVPGVAIERFEASDDPDHFSVEGGNVTVRGLNRTRAEINGRDGFSASGGGGLNFSDISPQMVGAVEVVKSQSASLTEGGIAGNINLITRKPFDSDELILGATIKASYADLIDDTTPEASAVVSNVWDTNSGKFGALFSITASNFTSRADGVGIFNYKPVTNTGSNPDGDNLFAPISGSARQQENDRDRLGIAGSLQWANPSETVQTTLEFIRSDSTLSWTERFIEFPAQPFANDAASDNINLSNATYDCPQGDNIPCTFTSGVIEGTTGFTGNPYYASGARNRKDERTVNDLSFNVEYAPTENLTIIGDIQYISATNKIYDMSALARIASTDTFLDLRGSEEVQIEILNKEGSSLTVDNPASYFMRSGMDFASDNEAEETAFQLDGEYAFDNGIINAVKAGFRVSNRTFDYQESEYNWGSLAETWLEADAEAGKPEVKILDGSEQLQRGYLEEFTFNNHLNGKSLTVNNTFYVPSASALSNKEAFYDSAIKDGVAITGSSWIPLSRRSGVVEGTEFLPSEIGSIEEDRTSFYLQLDFGSEDTAVSYSGNVGLRYVSWQLASTGSHMFGPRTADGGLFNGEINQFFNPDDNGWNQFGKGNEDWMHPDSYKDYYTDAAFEDFIQTEYAKLGASPSVEDVSTFWGTTVPAHINLEANAELKAATEKAIEAHYANIKATKEQIEGYLNRESGGRNTIEGDEFTRVLPSFNLKLGITDEFIVRFAASESIFLPTLDRVRNSSRITASIQQTKVDNPTDKDYKVVAGDALTDKYREDERIETASLTGFVANGGGNPYLQPELSTNYDITFEWYFDDVGSLTSSFFHKRIRDYFRQSTVIEQFTNSAGISQPVAVTSTQNAGTAKVQGYELALQTGLGFLGEGFTNFGIQTSYTFIDGSSKDYGVTEYGVTEGDAYALEFTYNNIRDLPLEGLSSDNANFVAYYDNGTFQTRFAYNWRSKYLLNSRDAVAFAPVYGEATGQLDWSMAYSITENVKIGLEANNLLNEVTKTSIANEINPSTSSDNQETVQSPRSYFVNDRRFAAFIQAQF